MSITVDLEFDEFSETDYLAVYRGQYQQMFFVVKVPKRMPRPLPDTLKLNYPQPPKEEIE